MGACPASLGETETQAWGAARFSFPLSPAWSAGEAEGVDNVQRSEHSVVARTDRWDPAGEEGTT